MKLLQENKEAIIDLLKTHGSLSVDRITSLLKLSKTNVRQHLMSLEEQSVIERRYQKQGPGRPQLVFKIKEEAMDRLFPTAEPRLLRELLQHLVDSGNEEIIKNFLDQFWKDRLDRFKELLAKEKKDTPLTRLSVLRRLLSEEGFMPKVTTDRGQAVVKECNCPFRETVKVTSLPCLLELRFIENAFGSKASRLSYIPAGEPTCDYTVNIRQRKAK